MTAGSASKQMQAYWRAEMRWTQKWENQPTLTELDKLYGPYQITQQRLIGFATGWIAGVAWAKRQKKAKTS